MARINHLPPTVLTTGVHNPNGNRVTPMTADRAKRQQARRAGGQVTQGTGQAYAWSSDAARKAAKRRWRRRHGTKGTRKTAGTHWARGRFLTPAKRRPSVTQAMRVVIRDEHRHKADLRQPLWYDPVSGQWWVSCGGQGHARSISERAALVRLGYLKSHRGYVPERVFGFQPGGTQIAQQEKS